MSSPALPQALPQADQATTPVGSPNLMRVMFSSPKRSPKRAPLERQTSQERRGGVLVPPALLVEPALSSPEILGTVSFNETPIVKQGENSGQCGIIFDKNNLFALIETDLSSNIYFGKVKHTKGFLIVSKDGNTLQGCVIFKNSSKRKSAYELEYANLTGGLARGNVLKISMGECLPVLITKFSEMSDKNTFYAQIDEGVGQGNPNWASYKLASRVGEPRCRQGGDFLEFVGPTRDISPLAHSDNLETFKNWIMSLHKICKKSGFR